jgi:hypothetical protein
VEVPDEFNKRFRQKVIEKYGSKKGALALAIREAMELWLRAQK